MGSGTDSTRIVDLFSEALERPEAEREQFVARACGADECLKARVTQLLSGVAGGFMEIPAAELERELIGGEDEPGQRVGAWELVRPIASGGMGMVWLARRADESFEAVAALKLIKRGMDTDDILNRFRAERQVLANLRHPNIAALLDGGVTADGRPFLVMEYVEGQPIDRYCGDRGLGVRERVSLFRKVCAAVEHAHRNTVVHRDIKPANILVTADGTPKLLDFGIAKVVTERPADAGRGTRTQQRILTPGYASPEQVRGEPITTATDVYSLGVVLYEVLTGRRPYRIETGSQAALERAICETEPVRPSTAVGLATEDEWPATERRASQRQLSGDLDTIVLMALRKEPSRRYGSVEAFSEDLRRYLEGLPVLARPDTLRYRTGKFVRRNRVLVVAGIAVMASMVVGLAASTTMYMRARDAREAESLQRRIAEGKTEEADRLRGLAEWRAYSAQVAAALGARRAGDVAGARQSLELTAPELRGWEYRYALGQLDASVSRFVAHPAFIYGLAVSPDQTILATAAEDGLVRLWDLATQEFRCTIPYFNMGVGNIAFSPDGALLAIPTGPRETMLWDVRGQREVQRLGGHASSVRAVAFSPDGLTIATAGADRRGILWMRPSVDAPFTRGPVVQAEGQVRGVAISPDGSLLATASFDRIVRLWETRTGEVRAVFKGHTSGVYTVAFSPDSRMLASASLDRTVRLWNVDGDAEPRVLRGHTERVLNVAFSPDGRLVASVSWDRTVRLWDPTSGLEVATFLGHENNVAALAFTADSHWLYSGSNDGTVRVWEVPRNWAVAQDADTRRAVALMVEPGRTLVALGLAATTEPSGIYEWDAARNRPGRQLIRANADTMCAGAGGGVIAVGLADGTVMVAREDVEVNGELQTRVLSGYRARVRAVAVSGDGVHVASGAEDGAVRLWEAASGREIRSWMEDASFVRAVAFSRDDRWIASVSQTGLLVVRDLEGGSPRRLKLRGDGTALAFSPDGRWLAAASGLRQQEIALLSWPSLERGATMRGHTHNVIGLGFSPDSTRLASGSMDHTVKLWDVGRGMEAATLYGHEYGVYSVAFSRDGNDLFTGATDGSIRVWSAAAESAARPGPEAR